MFFNFRVLLAVVYINILQCWCFPIKPNANNGECTTSTYTGKCVNLRNCLSLFHIFMNLEKLPHNYTDRIKDSQCGFDKSTSDSVEQILVCCPPILQKDDNAKNWADNLSSNQKLEVDNSHCGVVSKVDNGLEQMSDHFPWMALIEYVDIRDETRRGLNCSASLINNRYILTAAHCVRDKYWKARRILLGDWSSKTDVKCLNYSPNTSHSGCLPLNSQIVNIDTIISHPKYENNHYHDIALIRLKQKIEYTNYIRPICLPTDNTMRRTNLTGILTEYISWSHTSNDAFISNRKTKIPLRIWNTEKCQRRYMTMERNINLRYEICAGGEQDVDTCNGDSGGALMYYQYHDSFKVAFVVGVMSGGTVPCGLQGWPNISIDVKRHLDWILKHMMER